MRVGDTLELLDGAGTVVRCRLAKDPLNAAPPNTHQDRALLLPLQTQTVPPPRPQLCLLQGLSTADPMDFTVQKGTELGLAHFVAVHCERSVGQLEAGRAVRKLAHWRAVAASACQQSGNPWLAVVEGPLAWKDALAWSPSGPCAGKKPGTRWVLDPHAPVALATLLKRPPPWRVPEASTALQALNGGSIRATADRLTLLVGPEGGLSDAEAGQAASAGFLAVHLGPRTLRTETAALAALAAIQAAWGDWIGPEGPQAED
jgi:16S rRNA (uracil1498-N3)-methyltransferase